MKTLFLCMVFSHSVLCQPIVRGGLVAYYPFNSNALDESGHGNDAIVYGASLASDRFANANSAYSFDGIDDFIEAVSTTVPTSHASRTLCFWQKTSQDTIASMIDIGTIETIDSSTIFDIYDNKGSVSSCLLGFGGWASNDNMWHHVAVVYEDTTQIVLYQDGHENVRSWGPGIRINTVGSSIRIGAPISSRENRQCFLGILDDIRIYDRALSDVEVDSLYRENMSVSVPEFPKNIPTAFALRQNFPNPFNPTTKILFSLSSRSNVTLKIFDLIGREVALLVSEEMPAGNYSKQWNAENMTAGSYFYRLQVGSSMQTKKLILLK